MTGPARRRLPPAKARAYRRAAALYTHWAQRAGGEGESAVFQEITSDDEWVDLACALMHLTDGLVRAARDGTEEAHLACVLREAMLDEVTAGGNQPDTTRKD